MIEICITDELDLLQTEQVPHQNALKELVDRFCVQVTGVGSGIGPATVNLFAESGAQISPPGPMLKIQESLLWWPTTTWDQVCKIGSSLSFPAGRFVW